MGTNYKAWEVNVGDFYKLENEFECIVFWSILLILPGEGSISISKSS